MRVPELSRVAAAGLTLSRVLSGLAGMCCVHPTYSISWEWQGPCGMMMMYRKAVPVLAFMGVLMLARGFNGVVSMGRVVSTDTVVVATLLCELLFAARAGGEPY